MKSKIGDIVVRIDPRYFRPTEVDLLIGDPTKAQTQLGWMPKYNLKGIIEEMVASDVDLFKKELHLINSGHTVYKQEE
jgi:GDPmannose 4,6-dehydratase